MGNWVLSYSIVAERDFYYNKMTKKSSWDMPDEVRVRVHGMCMCVGVGYVCSCRLGGGVFAVCLVFVQ